MFAFFDIFFAVGFVIEMLGTAFFMTDLILRTSVFLTDLKVRMNLFNYK
jgi:hypothetical protein